jgi:hypothetical protein
MTIDTDKLKALALGYEYENGDHWYNEHQVSDGISYEPASEFIVGCDPATVLELIAEVERLRTDTARLDFMITDECQIERMDRIGAAPLYRLRWPWLEEQQAEWSATPREAIDEAIAAKEPPCSS